MCPCRKDGGEILDDTRIRETVPTIEYALRRKAKVILCSHLGRPKGKVVASMSLRPVVDRLRELLDGVLGLDENVGFAPDCVGEVATELVERSGAGSERCCLRTCAFMPGKRRTTPSVREAAGRVVRCVCERRIWQRAPGARVYRRNHALCEAGRGGVADGV